MNEPGKIWTTMSSGQSTDENAKKLIDAVGIGQFITDETEKTHLRNTIKLCAETGNCDGMYELLAKIVSEKIATPKALQAGVEKNSQFPQQIITIYLLLQRLLPESSPLKLSGINNSSIPSTLPEMTTWVKSWWNGDIVEPWKGNKDTYDPTTWKTSLERTTEVDKSVSTTPVASTTEPAEPVVPVVESIAPTTEPVVPVVESVAPTTEPVVPVVESIAPTEHAVSVVESVAPTEPVVSVAPTEPVVSVAPTEPVVSVAPTTESVAHVTEPAESVAHVTEPAESVAPVTPVTEPAESAAPVTEPAESVAPVTEPAESIAPTTESAAPVTEPAAPVTKPAESVAPVVEPTKPVQTEAIKVGGKRGLSIHKCQHTVKRRMNNKQKSKKRQHLK